MVVLFKKNLNMQLNTVFLGPKDRLTILDVIHVSKKSFRLVAVYTLNECRQAVLNWDTETFLVMSITLSSIHEWIVLA